jgi:hypothetical protein
MPIFIDRKAALLGEGILDWTRAKLGSVEIRRQMAHMRTEGYDRYVQGRLDLVRRELAHWWRESGRPPRARFERMREVMARRVDRKREAWLKQIPHAGLRADEAKMAFDYASKGAAAVSAGLRATRFEEIQMG